MAELHRGATLSPTKLELLAAWMGGRRWYAAKGHTPSPRLLASWRLDDPAGEVGVETLLVADDAGPEPVVYQVPLTYRDAPLAGADEALVGTLEHSVLGRRWVYDAPHDPVYAAELLALLQGRVRAASSTRSGAAEPTVRGLPSPAWPSTLTVSGSRVLSGEQSNTSVVLHCVDERGREVPVIVKVFRTLQPGPNPDVVLQSALVQAGCHRVADVVGALEGRWPGGSEEPVHLAMAQRFLPGVQDAWRVALQTAQAGADFSGPARELGEATAEVHEVLGRALGTTPATPELVRDTLASMRRRAAAAVAQVPELGPRAEHIDAVLEAAAAGPWPAFQRVHGDYHLGQVLRSPDLGWVLLDFEGEPMRPLRERSRPDQALRDVAGMLRSLDYAGDSVERAGGPSARGWVEAASGAFLAGYAVRSGADPRRHLALLTALELDKALYEVVYEARNRPSWVGIPLAAVDRLLAGAARGPARSDAAPSDPPPADAAPADPPPADAPPADAPLADPSRTDDERAPVSPNPSPEVSGAITALVQGRHQQPHDLLGQHLEPGGLRIRVLRPLAERVRVRFEDGEELTLAHEAEGVFTAVREGVSRTMDYRLLVSWADGVEHLQDDPYRFAPTLGQVDLHLVGEGRHEQLWTVLGARVHEYPGPMGTVRGTSFAVWAPRAKAVRVIGDFNSWDGHVHPMRLLGESGVWELFVPGVVAGSTYKFEIRGADDIVRAKADPMARRTEVPPNTGSVVDEAFHEWGDDAWMERRARTNPHTGPMSVYEVHLSSWRQGLTYRDMAEHLVNYVSDLGFTHVELLPVMEHPFGPSWGYQVTGYYAPTARFGTPDDFKYLVDRLHQNGIGIILDWVPGHFPRDDWALARFDGLALYEHPDPRRGDQPDWGTHVFDFGRLEVRNFLVANAIYWLEEFHADGLRVDAVASMLYLDYSRKDGEWVPNQYGGREYLEAIGFLQEANATAYKRVPGIVTIAEESTSWPGVTRPTDGGGLGFGLKWNMGWMNDTLRYLALDPFYRQYHHNQLTFSLMYAFSENYVLPVSHDEVVHGKGSLVGKIPGQRGDQMATLRAYLAYMWSHPGKPLLFMGCEFAQPGEWADGRSLDWWLLDQPAHYRVHNLVKELNRLYRDHDALWRLDSDPAGFRWLDANDNTGNTFSYLRFAEGGHGGDVVAVAVNFSGDDKEWVRLGVPRPGRWRVILDTSGYDQHGTPSQADVVLEAEQHPWNDQAHSVTVRLAAFTAIYLAPDEDRPVPARSLR